MHESPQYHYLTVDLDPEILSNPFNIQTNWSVITGAACTGKTTLINQLAERGYPTYPESAREFFNRELVEGKCLETIREDVYTLQSSIHEMQLAKEQRIPPNQLAFLDRALPDSISFSRIFGLDPNELLKDCFTYRYASVFILDRLPLMREKTLGPEDEASSSFLNEWLAKDYRALGYNVIRVPPCPPQERLAFLLEQMTGHEMKTQ